MCPGFWEYFSQNFHFQSYPPTWVLISSFQLPTRYRVAGCQLEMFRMQTPISPSSSVALSGWDVKREPSCEGLHCFLFPFVTESWSLPWSLSTSRLAPRLLNTVSLLFAFPAHSALSLENTALLPLPLLSHDLLPSPVRTGTSRMLLKLISGCLSLHLPHLLTCFNDRLH